MKRAIVIIIDGVGVGELPDADKYGDTGSDTLGNIAQQMENFKLPNLEKLGLGKIAPVAGLNGAVSAMGNYGKMAELSPGKDSTTGHWELAGIILNEAFPVYPSGFPAEIIREFVRLTGIEVLGNVPASGTEIIKKFGEEHLRGGKLIVYTSADSVFQIAAHQELYPLERLYEICQTARVMLNGKHAVARVIARPFTGSNAENFTRTVYRKDFSLPPFDRTLHYNLQEAGWMTVGIGKINDLYAGYGIQKNINTKTNDQGMQAILYELNETSSGLIMANLVDFDMLWGHRNDVAGFYHGLQQFDDWLLELMNRLDKDDLVIITADHGNDPTTPGTDHSREYVPLLVFGENLRQNQNLGIRATFADVQATLAEYFNIPSTGCGTSFMQAIV